MKAPEDVDVGCGGPRNTEERKRVPEDGGAQMREPVNRGLGGRFCPRQPEKAHKDLRWFREEIPYVHRSISE
ncbi:hypothetical protein AXF42_Ash004178 [Apostasia shenzhenica]|uniref:Uncharacterized protein n=1 Tax=Apostasia shenzhenica TaxID=1088818 RepID=A0A2I0A285_9ASPA|nr:hypothetical protein AXF42_Ash004178 [Apostasia shenzhenica]